MSTVCLSYMFRICVCVLHVRIHGLFRAIFLFLQERTLSEYLRSLAVLSTAQTAKTLAYKKNCEPYSTVQEGSNGDDDSEHVEVCTTCIVLDLGTV